MKGNSKLIGVDGIVSRRSAGGIHDLFDQSTNNIYSSWPLVPQFISLVNNNSIYENSYAGFTLTSAFLAKDITLYWTIAHISTSSSDFYNGTVSGSFTQFSSTNSGSFTVELMFIGNPAKANRYFIIEIRTDSISGPVVYTSQIFSIPPIVINNIYFNVNPYNEGSYYTYLFISTSQCGTSRYYGVSYLQSGTATSADFFVYTTYTRAVGGTWSYRAIGTTNDFTTEGTETLTYQISYNGYTWGSVTLNINDSSIYPNITSVTPSANPVAEGTTLRFTVIDSNGGTGTLYYTTSGITSADTSTALSSSFNIVNGTGTIDFPLFAGDGTETETIQLSVRHGSTSGTILASSPWVDITDTAAAALDVSFYESRYGSSMGTQHVYIVDASTGTILDTVYTASGDLGVTTWYLRNCSTYYGTGAVRVCFHHLIGSNFYADWAIDNVTINGTTTTWESDQSGWITPNNTTHYTTSETALAASSQIIISTATGSSRWNLDSGTTPSSSTGPASADTGVYFAYTESSSYFNTNHWLFSPIINL